MAIHPAYAQMIRQVDGQVNKCMCNSERMYKSGATLERITPLFCFDCCDTLFDRLNRLKRESGINDTGLDVGVLRTGLQGDLSG